MVNRLAVGDGDPRVFAALGDPTRQRIVALLGARDLTVSEIATQFPISLPATLKHLRVLDEAGVVSRTKAGRVVTVSLERDALADAERWLHRARTFWTGRLQNLAQHVSDHPTTEEPS